MFRLFKWSVILLLLTAALGKFISSGSSASGHLSDPVFSVELRSLLWLAGVMELVVVVICLAAKNDLIAAGAIAWLATNFALYRFGLWWAGSTHSCGCFGNITEVLHISTETADLLMKIILAYLFFGGYFSLFCFLRQKRSNNPPASMPQVHDVSA